MGRFAITTLWMLLAAGCEPGVERSGGHSSGSLLAGEPLSITLLAGCMDAACDVLLFSATASDPVLAPVWSVDGVEVEATADHYLVLTTPIDTVATISVAVSNDTEAARDTLQVAALTLQADGEGGGSTGKDPTTVLIPRWTIVDGRLIFSVTGCLLGWNAILEIYDEDDPSKVFRFDLETGTLIDWGLAEDVRWRLGTNEGQTDTTKLSPTVEGDFIELTLPQDVNATRLRVRKVGLDTLWSSAHTAALVAEDGVSTLSLVPDAADD